MMQKLLAAAGICLMALAGPAAASTQTVITFDDVTWDLDQWGYSSQPIPDGYGGVASWEGGRPWVAHSTCCDAYGNSTDDFGVFGISVSMKFSAPVSFVGAHAGFSSSVWAGYSLFYKGSQVFGELYTLDNPWPNDDDRWGGWISSGYSGPVDQIVFFDGYEGTLIDNVTYAAAPVPEPGSVAMVLAGLGLVGGLARRRQAKD